MDEFINQAELELRSDESLKAIEKGDILSIDSFRNEIEEWRKKNIK